jgi:protein phosphatase
MHLSELSTAVRTNVGLVRERNEDAVHLATLNVGAAGDGIVMVVADGMGGVSGGATASSLTIEVISQAISSLPSFLHGADNTWHRRLSSWLRDTAVAANRAVRQLAADQPSLKGMGSTLLLGVIVDGWLGLAWAGDSRAYLLRNGTLVQLTRDHTWDMDQELEGKGDHPDVLSSPYRGLLTSAIGQHETLSVGLRWELMQQGDLLLLASDGLTKYYDAELLASTIAEDALIAPEVNALAERLIARANAAGGADNISVGLVSVVGSIRHMLPAPIEATQSQVPHRAWQATVAPSVGVALNGISRDGRSPASRSRSRRVAVLASTCGLCLTVGVSASVMYANGGAFGGRRAAVPVGGFTGAATTVEPSLGSSEVDSGENARSASSPRPFDSARVADAARRDEKEKIERAKANAATKIHPGRGAATAPASLPSVTPAQSAGAAVEPTPRTTETGSAATSSAAPPASNSGVPIAATPSTTASPPKVEGDGAARRAGDESTTVPNPSATPSSKATPSEGILSRTVGAVGAATSTAAAAVISGLKKACLWCGGEKKDTAKSASTSDKSKAKPATSPDSTKKPPTPPTP